MDFRLIINSFFGIAFLTVNILNCSGTNVFNTDKNSSDALDLDFEGDINLEPPIWTLISNKYGCKPEIDKTKAYTGNKSLKLSCGSDEKPEMIYAINTFLTDIATDSISISAYVKVESLNKNSALNFFYQLNTEKESPEPIYIPYSRKEINNDWKIFNFSLPLKKGISGKFLVFGFTLEGKGEAWVDNIKISIDGLPYSEKLNRSIPLFSTKQINAIKTNLSPISSFEIQESNNDLAVLNKIVDTSKIVMLGEGTHGTSEFTRLKTRIISYLVSDLDFNIIAIEANMPEVKLLNDYISSNSEIAKDKLEDLKFFFYQSEEYFELIKWIQSYNQNSEKKILLTGFDMQYLEQSVKDLISFSSKDSRLLAIISVLEKNLPTRFESDSNRNKTISIVEDIKEYILKNQDSKFFNSKDVPWGLQSCEIIIQKLNDDENDFYSNYRDKKMAENISWTIEQNPNSKIIVWAHNEHIKKNENMMGESLSKLFDGNIISIAFTTGDGVYTAKSYTDSFATTTMKENNILKKPDPYSWEYGFHQTTTPAFLLILDDIKNSFTENNKNKRFRSIGAIATPNQFYPSSLFEEFDAVIYIDKTTSISLF